MGRKCCVPNCYTGYATCKEKASMFRVPDDDFFLNQWQEAIAREDRIVTPKDFVCEKHFKSDDLIRSRFVHNIIEKYKVPKLKQDAIPSVFPDFPESIKKMVKKRRKIPVMINEVQENNIFNTNKNEFSIIENIQNIDIKIKEEIQSECLQSNEIIDNCEIHIKTEIDEDFENSEVVELAENDLNLGSSLYSCDKCHYTSKYLGNLKTHQTKHLTGDEAYFRCEHCPNFKSKWPITFKNHQRIRHGIGKQEVHKCSVCNFETKVKICLKRHLIRHANEEAKRTKSKVKNKLLHYKNNERNKVYKCNECSFETNINTYFLNHKKHIHNDMVKKDMKPKKYVNPLKDKKPKKYVNPLHKGFSKTKLKQND